jgi:hypothetical protein
MQAEQKRILLLKAIELLNEADCLAQEALGATDACYDIHNSLQDVAEELEAQIG